MRRKASAMMKWRDYLGPDPSTFVAGPVTEERLDPVAPARPPTPLADAAIASLAVVAAALPPRRLSLQDMMTAAYRCREDVVRV